MASLLRSSESLAPPCGDGRATACALGIGGQVNGRSDARRAAWRYSASEFCAAARSSESVIGGAFGSLGLTGPNRA